MSVHKWWAMALLFCVATWGLLFWGILTITHRVDVNLVYTDKDGEAWVLDYNLTQVDCENMARYEGLTCEKENDNGK